MAVLSNVSAVPGGKPFEPFGKDSICSEGGSTGRRANWPCHIKIADTVKLLRPSVQLPAGIHGWRGLKGIFARWQGKVHYFAPLRGSGYRRLDIAASCGVFRPTLAIFG